MKWKCHYNYRIFFCWNYNKLWASFYVMLFLNWFAYLDVLFFEWTRVKTYNFVLCMLCTHACNMISDNWKFFQLKALENVQSNSLLKLLYKNHKGSWGEVGWKSIYHFIYFFSSAFLENKVTFSRFMTESIWFHMIFGDFFLFVSLLLPPIWIEKKRTYK